GLLPAAVLSGFPAKPSAESVGSLLALSVFGSAVAYLLYYHLVLNVRPTQTALVTYLNPATAVFWGWLVLGEPVTGQTLAGLVLIVAGIAVVNARLTAAGSAAAPRGSPVAPPRSPQTGSGRRR
ncbi:MAG: DMT family transporter, partial [Firmicutes bacterium]|nr:DMT family transporter [Bacillota bacterium]